MAVFTCRPCTVDAVKYKGGLLFDSYPDWLIDMMREEDITPAGSDVLWVVTSDGRCHLRAGSYLLRNLSTLKTTVMSGEFFKNDFLTQPVESTEEVSHNVF